MYKYWVYIVGNRGATNIYIGVTNDIKRRISEHKLGEVPGFTKRYKCDILLYFEEYNNIKNAISREKKA